VHVFLGCHVLANLSKDIKAHVLGLVEFCESCGFALDLGEVASDHLPYLKTFAVFNHYLPVRCEHFELVLQCFVNHNLFHYFVKLFLNVEAPEKLESFVLEVFVAGVNLLAAPQNVLKVEEAILHS
jgi:hypothetical protein